MSAKLWSVATTNGFSTTLDGTISETDNSITLTTTTGLEAPGVLVIDRQNSDATDTPNQREYITFTGISLNTLTGCSRGVAGSSSQEHSSGALVEEVMTVTHWRDLLEFLSVSHNSSGNLLTSAATINNLNVVERLNVSGASIIGAFPIHPTFVIPSGLTSGATSVGFPLQSPQSGNLTFLSVQMVAPVSLATLAIDFNKNGTSIFTDQNTRPILAPGVSFFSTASFGAPIIVSGEKMTIDIDKGGSESGFVVVGRIA